METSAFAFPLDLADEGVDTVLENVSRRGGLDGITLAVLYHEARDLLPHNPAGKVRFLEGGTTCFPPDPALYGALVPLPARATAGRDLLAEAVAAAERRGLAVHAWTVFLHADRVREPIPEACERNAFGDPLLTELCPANPAVRAYVRGVSADVARRGVRTIVAESLHYHPLEHGFHHERYFLALSARTRFLLGLCFCEHCAAAARAAGVDSDGLRRFAATEVQRVFDGGADAGPAELTREEACSLAGGELAGYLEARERIVASLAGEAAGAARAGGARVSFMDASGAIKGYASGNPEGAPAPEIAWRLGVDLAACARAAGGLEAVAYAAAPERVRLDLEAYCTYLGGEAVLAAALRPMPPDCDSSGNLAAKLALARELGLERVDLYHYGLAPLTALDLIREALAG